LIDIKRKSPLFTSKR